MNKIIGIICMVFSLANAAKAQMGEWTVQPMTEEKLKSVAAVADKSCPEMLNKDTRLDSVRYLDGMILCNYYTMPNATAAEIAKLRKQTGDDRNDEGKKLPGNTYRIQHKFYDKNGVYMFTKTQYQ